MFIFSNPSVGQYQLRVDPLAESSFTHQSTGSEYSVDSDFDPATELTSCPSGVSKTRHVWASPLV